MKPPRDTHYPDGTLEPPYAPVETSMAERAFPALVSHLMPPYEALPDIGADIDGDWIRLAADMVLRGVHNRSSFMPKEGIDAEVAFWHLICLRGSYEPKHQVKIASMAFLAECWFQCVYLDTTDQVYGTLPEGLTKDDLVAPLSDEKSD